MIEIAALIKQIEAYCVRHGIEETTFGLRAVNDGKFVQRLRDGANMTIATIDKARSFIRDSDAGKAA